MYYSLYYRPSGRIKQRHAVPPARLLHAANAHRSSQALPSLLQPSVKGYTLSRARLSVSIGRLQVLSAFYLRVTIQRELQRAEIHVQLDAHFVASLEGVTIGLVGLQLAITLVTSSTLQVQQLTG